MRRIFKNLLLTIIWTLLLVGCTGKSGIEEQLEGSWYLEGYQDAAFILYDDGTCEISGEYGAGTWSIVNDNELKLTNILGETETAPIVSVEDDCLTLGEGNNLVKFWSSPQVTELDETSEQGAVLGEVETESDIKDAWISIYQTEDYSLGTFICGAAIVKYEIDDEYKGALINREGTVVTELDTREFWASSRDIITGACYSDNSVIDVEGRTIFTVDEGQRIMCVGDSMILVYEEAVGFESAEARIGVITFDGEWTVPITSDNLMINDEKNGLRCSNNWRYVGEGCFIVDNDSPYRYGGFETVIFDVYNNSSAVIEGILESNATFENGMIKYRDIFMDHKGKYVKEMEDAVDIGTGMVYAYGNKTLYNFSGEVIKDYSQYENAEVTYFHDGYGYFESKGADGKRYFSIIDSKGEFLFDPIIKERTYSNQPNGFYGDFYNGEFVTDQKSFDLRGNMLYDFKDSISGCREGIVIVDNKYMSTRGELIEPMVLK